MSPRGKRKTNCSICAPIILVNVGDNKITSNDDIREFNRLDTEGSDKQFILLVNKGREGWNCRSLESAVDAIVHVPWFILVGIHEMLTSFVLATTLVPVWWGILYVVAIAVGGASTAGLQAGPGWMVAALCASSSVVLRLPSRSMRHRVRIPQIARLAQHIRSIASDEATIKLLQSGVASMDTVGSQRITRINWLLGLYWAGLVWAASHWTFATEVPAALKQEATSRIFAGLLIFLFFGAGASCYEATVRMVRQTIDFAFLEAWADRPARRGALAGFLILRNLQNINLISALRRGRSIVVT